MKMMEPLKLVTLMQLSAPLVTKAPEASPEGKQNMETMRAKCISSKWTARQAPSASNCQEASCPEADPASRKMPSFWSPAASISEAARPAFANASEAVSPAVSARRENVKTKYAVVKDKERKIG